MKPTEAMALKNEINGLAHSLLDDRRLREVAVAQAKAAVDRAADRDAIREKEGFVKSSECQQRFQTTEERGPHDFKPDTDGDPACVFCGRLKADIEEVAVKTSRPFIHVGAPVRYYRKDRDESAVIDGLTANGPFRRVGSKGVVVELKPAESPHPCVNHDDGPDDCYCGGRDDATIPAKDPCAVVEWEYDDNKTKVRRLIHPKDEGSNWQRVCSICEKPRTEVRDGNWINHPKEPAHMRCGLAGSVKALEDAGLRPVATQTTAEAARGHGAKLVGLDNVTKTTWKPSPGDAVWVPSGSGWRPGIVQSQSKGDWSYIMTWSQSGRVPSNTKPPGQTQTSRREPWTLKKRDKKGERP